MVFGASVGRFWYCSRDYDRGWAFYDRVPGFYFDVDPGWRGFRETIVGTDIHGNYERITNERLRQNWKGWNNNHYWEKQGSYGIKGYQPRSPQQRQALRIKGKSNIKRGPKFSDISSR